MMARVRSLEEHHLVEWGGVHSDSSGAHSSLPSPCGPRHPLQFILLANLMRGGGYLLPCKYDQFVILDKNGKSTVLLASSYACSIQTFTWPEKPSCWCIPLYLDQSLCWSFGRPRAGVQVSLGSSFSRIKTWHEHCNWHPNGILCHTWIHTTGPRGIGEGGVVSGSLDSACIKDAGH